MHHKRRIIFVSLTALLAITLVGVMIIMSSQQLIRRPARALSTLPSNVDMHLTGINYTETKKGRKEWTLKADSLRYSKSNESLIFDKVEVSLYDSKQGKIKVTSDKASYDRQSNLVTLEGHVVIEDFDGYRLVAHKMDYGVDSRVITISGRFRIMGPGIKMSGNDLTLDIDARHLKVHRQARVSVELT